jgi:hypothetical protein
MRSRARRLTSLATLAALAGLSWTPIAPEESLARAGGAGTFTVATAHFEQNATDGDVEVVFEAKGGADGLSKLTIVGPNGRTVVDFAARDASTLGMRSFRFETPEPKDAASLKAAYPAGEYVFSGATNSGQALHGRAMLSHGLPALARFVRPAPEAENVGLKDVVLAWTPVKDMQALVVYVEQEELGLSVTARLPGSASSFAVPAGFLAPGTEYVMGIGTVAKDGNASYVESSFKTAAK